MEKQIEEVISAVVKIVYSQALIFLVYVLEDIA